MDYQKIVDDTYANSGHAGASAGTVTPHNGPSPLPRVRTPAGAADVPELQTVRQLTPA
jgi:hypothetical protein